MGCFPVDFQEAKRPLRTKSLKRPIKVGKRPIKEGKRPIKAKVLVGVSVGCLMGCFRAPPPWRKTAPLKRPIKRSMTKPGGFPLFSGKVQIVSRTLSGLFLVGALNRSRTQWARRDRLMSRGSRDNFCLSLVSQLPSPRGNFERG